MKLFLTHLTTLNNLASYYNFVISLVLFFEELAKPKY
jgi:hypothetical protein